MPILLKFVLLTLVATKQPWGEFSCEAILENSEEVLEDGFQEFTIETDCTDCSQMSAQLSGSQASY